MLFTFPQKYSWSISIEYPQIGRVHLSIFSSIYSGSLVVLESGVRGFISAMTFAFFSLKDFRKLGVFEGE